MPKSGTSIDINKIEINKNELNMITGLKKSVNSVNNLFFMKSGKKDGNDESQLFSNLFGMMNQVSTEDNQFKLANEIKSNVFDENLPVEGQQANSKSNKSDNNVQQTLFNYPVVDENTNETAGQSAELMAEFLPVNTESQNINESDKTSEISEEVLISDISVKNGKFVKAPEFVQKMQSSTKEQTEAQLETIQTKQKNNRETVQVSDNSNQEVISQFGTSNVKQGLSTQTLENIGFEITNESFQENLSPEQLKALNLMQGQKGFSFNQLQKSISSESNVQEKVSQENTVPVEQVEIDQTAKKAKTLELPFQFKPENETKYESQNFAPAFNLRSNKIVSAKMPEMQSFENVESNNQEFVSQNVPSDNNQQNKLFQNQMVNIENRNDFVQPKQFVENVQNAENSSQVRNQSVEQKIDKEIDNAFSQLKQAAANANVFSDKKLENISAIQFNEKVVIQNKFSETEEVKIELPDNVVVEKGFAKESTNFISETSNENPVVKDSNPEIRNSFDHQVKTNVPFSKEVVDPAILKTAKAINPEIGNSVNNQEAVKNAKTLDQQEMQPVEGNLKEEVVKEFKSDIEIPITQKELSQTKTNEVEYKSQFVENIKINNKSINDKVVIEEQPEKFSTKNEFSEDVTGKQVESNQESTVFNPKNVQPSENKESFNNSFQSNFKLDETQNNSTENLQKVTQTFSEVEINQKSNIDTKPIENTPISNSQQKPEIIRENVVIDEKSVEQFSEKKNFEQIDMEFSEKYQKTSQENEIVNVSENQKGSQVKEVDLNSNNQMVSPAKESEISKETQEAVSGKISEQKEMKENPVLQNETKFIDKKIGLQPQKNAQDEKVKIDTETIETQKNNLVEKEAITGETRIRRPEVVNVHFNELQTKPVDNSKKINTENVEEIKATSKEETQNYSQSDYSDNQYDQKDEQIYNRYTQEKPKTGKESFEAKLKAKEINSDDKINSLAENQLTQKIVAPIQQNRPVGYTDMRDLIYRIERMISNASINRLSNSSLTIDGKEYGKIEIHVKRDNKEEQGVILVENEAVKEQLQKVLPDIHENLQQKGSAISAINVEVNDQKDDSESGFNNQQSRKKQDMQKGDYSVNLESKTRKTRHYGYNTMEILA